MLTFGQVLKFSHFYKPDFPLGKSAGCFHALNHTQTRCKSLKKTNEQNNKHSEKPNHIWNSITDYRSYDFYR